MSGRLPWERQKGESKLWYERFWAWLMSPKRSLLAVYNAEMEKAGKSWKKTVPRRWNEIFVEWRWEERAAAYDAHTEAERIRADEARKRQVMEQALASRYGRVLALIREAERLEKRLDDLDKEGKFNKGLYDTYRGVLSDIADELGQRKDYSDVLNVVTWSAEEWKKEIDRRLQEAAEARGIMDEIDEETGLPVDMLNAEGENG